MSKKPEGYDQAVSIYSPEGRIYQVEYARHAANRGSTTIGMKYRDGVVILAHKGRKSGTVRSDLIDKIHRLDKNNILATSGLIADARILVEFLRETITSEQITHGESPGSYFIANRLSDVLWMYTEYGSVRPFGVINMLAGPKRKLGDPITLINIDVTGSFEEVAASAIGVKSEEVTDKLVDEHKNTLTLTDAFSLAINSLDMVIDEDLDDQVIDMIKIKKDGYDFLSEKEAKTYLEKALK